MEMATIPGFRDRTAEIKQRIKALPPERRAEFDELESVPGKKITRRPCV